MSNSVPTVFKRTSEIIQKLIVSSGFNRRSQIGLVREAFDSIEEAHQNGFSYQTIEDELNGNGLHVKPGSLRNILRRIRKERSEPMKSSAKPSVNKPAASLRPELKQAGESKDFTRSTRDPKDLF
jgi:hypothetical protein